MERTPMQTPLPCFGLEYSAVDPVCQACPHKIDCLHFMGLRSDKIPLGKLNFTLLPKDLRTVDSTHSDEPDAPYLRVLYSDCYLTVFGKKPKPDDSPDYYRDDVVDGARAAECSVRMFLLSNMVAQSIHEETQIAHTEKARSTKFHASMLKGERGVKRAVEYAKVCNDRYGTFSLSSLATFSGDDYEINEMDRAMLTSEVTAGQFIVAQKIHHGGPALEALYAEEELQLNPYWLAIEPSYMELVLLPFKAQPRGTRMLKDHRGNVLQVHGQLKRTPTMGLLAWKSRQKMMPQAVAQVLTYFNMRPDDLLHPAAPITDAMLLWRDIGVTIQHYHCWLFLTGQSSYFTRRTTKEVHIGS